MHYHFNNVFCFHYDSAVIQLRDDVHITVVLVYKHSSWQITLFRLTAVLYCKLHVGMLRHELHLASFHVLYSYIQIQVEQFIAPSVHRTRTVCKEKHSYTQHSTSYEMCEFFIGLTLSYFIKGHHIIKIMSLFISRFWYKEYSIIFSKVLHSAWLAIFSLGLWLCLSSFPS